MREPVHHHKEVLNFTGISYCYCSWQLGYGGLNWSGLERMDTSLFQHEPWCDTGYQNVAAATGASALGWFYYDGAAESVNPAETFSFKSMIVASAWSTNQEWRFNAYTYSSGALHLKGSEYFYLSQQAQTLHFGKLGKNIAAFSFQMMDLGSAGNTCTYGSGTYGYQMAIGNVTIVWNGKIPHHESVRHTPLPGQHAAHHPGYAAAHLASPGAHENANPHDTAQTHHAGAWHTQLLAFGHEPGSLTADFKLPQTEHFGT